jgi:nicotinic acid mononucleotide adenylyltransferase
MQPPTVGHGLLVMTVMRTAKAKKCDHVIYLSKTADSKKNPLDINTKVKWAKEMFPGANIVGATDQIRTFVEMVKDLNKKYNVLYFVAGGDRVEEYQTILNKYNGVEYNFDKIEIISAGKRDPDADGVSGMSATKMRNAAIANDLNTFKLGLPKEMSTHASKMMSDVRTGLKLLDKYT